MSERLINKICPYDQSPTTLSPHDDDVGIGFKLECIKCGSNKIAAKPIDDLLTSDDDLIQ